VKGADRFLEFVERTFGLRTTLRVPNQDGTVGHAEVRVGESVVMAFDAAPDWPDTPSFLSVYVDDVDEAYARALEAGATVVTGLMYSRITGGSGVPGEGSGGQYLVAADAPGGCRPVDPG
jgi:PhnB protein